MPQMPTPALMRRKSQERGGDLGKYKELIGKGGDDMVDAAGGRYMEVAYGKGVGTDIERLPPQPSS